VFLPGLGPHKTLAPTALQDDVDDQPDDKQNGDLYTGAHHNGSAAIFRVITAGTTAVFSISSIHTYLS